MHEVLVNRLGGLSLPRKSVVRLTDRPNMTLDVYRGRKTTMQQNPFPPCLWGIKFTARFPSVVNGVKFPIKQEPPVCRWWRLVCWKRDPGS